MARPLRIEFAGAWYHVMNRGAGRKPVFKIDTQREYFLALLAETHERFKAEWHGYCLMGNHYHLLVRTPEGNLQRIMRHINGLYTQMYNRSEHRDGPLFRGRYKAILVDAEEYWLELSRYLHRNPLEAGLVDDLKRYPWSSYRAYAGFEAAPAWLTTGYILNAIGTRDTHRRYSAYVARDTDQALADFYKGLKTSPLLGDDAFKAKVLSDKPLDVDRPELRATQVRPSLAEVVAATRRRFAVKEEEIWRLTRGRGARSPARPVAMYLCQRLGAMRLAEIAEVFGLSSYASAGASIRNLRSRLREDEGLAKMINLILLDLTPL